jgi:iron(III) transport system ATP-binding protein
MMTTTPLSTHPATAQPYLQINHVTKTFGQFVALSDISLEIFPGEFICFLGPSGCGKTTLLRVIAGLEEQNAGQIIQNGLDISRLPPSRRDFGIVFQSYALFPNLTASRNIAYGLENKRLKKPEIEQRVHELLELVGLVKFGHKYPAQLSGGQQQRVALARALALSPGLLLLDEPLSALDARVRASLRYEIAQLQRRLNITTIMVTHDQEESLTMADRIVVMDQGVIVQVGTPEEIYRRPSTPFVADFIGVMNFLPGVTTEQPHQIRCQDVILTVSPNGFWSGPGQPVTLAFRPEEVQLNGHPSPQVDALPVQLHSAEFLGSFYRLKLNMGHAPHLSFVADVPTTQARQAQLAEGHTFSIHLPPDAIRVFKKMKGDG